MTGKTEPSSSPLGALVGDLLCALAFLTRAPVPATSSAHARPLGQAAWAFPLVGLGVGFGAGAVLALAAALGVPPLAAGLLALGASATLTGALHEDGLADTLDGLWGGRDPARRLEIMRDSRIGGFGALGLVISVGLRAACLAAIVEGAGAEAAWLAFVAAAAAGRGALPAIMHLTPRASATGLGAMAGRPSADRAVIAAGLGTLALPLLLGPGAGPAAALLASIAAVKLALVARWKLGGYNGDVLGAAEQAVEIAVLLTAAAALSY
ncbi:MAG: adenosylcobinamide-GDP ribazoletransferase [Marivibrio sp.]|uniref:adenosylcobinamide-GDP ribazoletransferase n=1 Tax=Marivibrio sp. TaxID=2039719 RepID=UPI0032EC5041